MIVIQFFFCIFQLEAWFEKTLKEKKGWVIKKMGEDGACLFRAVGMFIDRVTRTGFGMSV